MLKNILIAILALGLTAGFAGEAKGKAVKAKKGDLAAGKKVFDTYCLICHGATGKGDGVGAAALNPKPRKFGDTAYMSLQTREKLRSDSRRRQVRESFALDGSLESCIKKRK
jgi:mono/diheme cytochrome c family protein